MTIYWVLMTGHNEVRFLSSRSQAFIGGAAAAAVRSGYTVRTGFAEYVSMEFNPL